MDHKDNQPSPGREPGNNRRRTARATRHLAMCAVLSALSVAVLGMGALIEVLDLTASVLAAVMTLPILWCYGRRDALLSYAVTAVLAVILLPQSLASWMYAGLVGYYPVLKQRVDRLPRVPAWVIKILLLTAVLLLYLVVFYFLVLGGEGSLTEAFLAGFGEVGGSSLMAWAVIGLSLATFILFDYVIDRLWWLYCFKWRRRVEKWMKP